MFNTYRLPIIRLNLTRRARSGGALRSTSQRPTKKRQHRHNAPTQSGVVPARRLIHLVLYGVDSDLRALPPSGGNREEETIETLLVLPKIASGSRTECSGYFREQAIVVRVGHLKGVDKSFSPRHVDSFAVSIEIKIVHVLDAL